MEEADKLKVRVRKVHLLKRRHYIILQYYRTHFERVNCNVFLRRFSSPVLLGYIGAYARGEKKCQVRTQAEAEIFKLKMKNGAVYFNAEIKALSEGNIIAFKKLRSAWKMA